MGQLKSFLIKETERQMKVDGVKYSQTTWAEYQDKVSHAWALEQARKAGVPISYCSKCEREMPTNKERCSFCGSEKV